ncbi:uncharacterized protein LOC111045521 [Nilaparvata lugens]|uniref:uncharacterized protein LOC111045521 n=1 Tax=Nilaparvata lugens TaxID=108931 RepID=UPI00193D6268|nr:uncharacterized protein LOC111045521 [Nilaparvata lugens]
MKGNAPDSSPYARVFYRVQMTVIGKTKVNEITLGTGITELYSISLPGGAVTVRYTDMRFYDAITRTSVVKLYYRNMSPSDMKVFITSNSAPVAHTPSDATATPRSLDVDYKLRPEGIYSTFISGDGYNLLVGSKPELDIDFGTASCGRVDYTGDHFKTELKIVAERDVDIYAHSTANIYTFSRPIQQQSWRCEYNKEKQNHKFIRVVNHLEFLLPVHTIESYDGVEILRRPFGEKYILEIFELKYLLENRDKPGKHLTPMRATGEISFAPDDRPTDTDTANAMGRGFNAISKSEVHPRFISQIPKRAHNRNDYYRAGSIKDYKTLKIDEEGHQQREMIFTTKLMEQDGRKGVNEPFTGLFVCTPGSSFYWMRIIRPYFEIFQDGKSLVNNSMEINYAKTKEYLGDCINQKWTCIKTGDTTAEKFLRITTKGDVIVKSDAHALNAIQFTPVDDVSLKLLESTGSSQNSKYKITYEGVRYYRHEEIASEGDKHVSKIINFDFGGYLILETTPSPNLNWRSGTMNIRNALSTSKDPPVYYSDGDRVREYSFHLPGDQSSEMWKEKKMMRIGESYRVKEKIRLNSGALECHEIVNLGIAETADSDNRLQTLVQTFKYSSEGNAAELEQSYHGRKTRVWECTSAPRQIKILRVMNNFLFNQADVENIRTILYSDGIAIFSGKKNTGDERIE